MLFTAAFGEASSDLGGVLFVGKEMKRRRNEYRFDVWSAGTDENAAR